MKYLYKIGAVVGGVAFAVPALAAQTADQLFPTASVSVLAETVLSRAITVLFAYWPAILGVAVTIGVAYFLISKALSAVRGHI